MNRKRWPDEHIAALRTLLADGRSYAQIGKALGYTRNAVAGAVRTYIKGLPAYTTPSVKKTLRLGMRYPLRWTDRVLTETWEERKARRERETRP